MITGQSGGTNTGTGRQCCPVWCTPAPSPTSSGLSSTICAKGRGRAAGSVFKNVALPSLSGFVFFFFSPLFPSAKSSIGESRKEFVWKSGNQVVAADAFSWEEAGGYSFPVLRDGEIGCKKSLGRSDSKSSPTGRASHVSSQHLQWGRRPGPCFGTRAFFLHKRGGPFPPWKESGRLPAYSQEPGLHFFPRAK